MKKLVKTAKQQFEERLNHFNLTQDWSNQSCVGRIGKDLDDEGIVIFIHESEDDGYSEYHYPSFSELRDHSNFVQNCLREFSCCDDNFILSMVKWFTYDSKENPFDAVDVYFPADTFQLNSSVNFGDIYEEVPDVRVITAKEQWENDSKDAKELWSTGVETLKVCLTDDYVKFYRLDDAITCYTYPSLELMRKDRWFVCQIVDTLSEACEHDKISPFIKWTRSGGDFPLPISIIFKSDYQEYTCHVYEDKELSQEQTIEEMIALTPKQQEEVKKFEAALKSLKDSGVKIISYWDENEFFAVNGNSNVDLDCSYYSSKKDYENSEDISVLLQKKHRFPFSWDLYWGVDTYFCAKKL